MKCFHFQNALHFNDACGALKCSFFNGHDVVPAQVQTLEIGQSVEEAKCWNPRDLVVIQQEPEKIGS